METKDAASGSQEGGVDDTQSIDKSNLELLPADLFWMIADLLPLADVSVFSSVNHTFYRTLQPYLYKLGNAEFRNSHSVTDTHTWLEFAIGLGLDDLAVRLLDNGADPRMQCTCKGNVRSENAVFLATLFERMEIFNKIDITKSDIYGPYGEPEITLLQLALGNGNFAMAQEILERGHGVNDPINKNFTPLHYAAYIGEYEIVKLLLQLGADVHHVGFRFVSITPLGCALAANIRYPHHDREKIINLLLERGASVEGYPGPRHLNVAAAQGYIPGVELLIHHGAIVNGDRYENTTTPLHFAVSLGHLECVNALLEAGASVNAKTEQDNTPLHYSAGPCVEYYPQWWVHEGFLHYPRFEKTANCMETLLKAGAAVDVQNHNRETPLHRAARHGWVACVEALINAGAVLDPKDRDNMTPLHIAVAWSHIDCVRMLVERGASVGLLADGRKLIDLTTQTQEGVEIRVFLELLTPRAVDEVEGTEISSPYHELTNGSDEDTEDVVDLGANPSEEQPGS
ncbi:ankyrin repeat-containing domain protein [Aspergillus pseudonomiae]|uniref:Ankyrin repeat-containing domain protein n=1 Tax=Aspergillus pseudonomiae TaxID=1506151 RepID=A0A5N6IKS7_9EURO|nr:ankyrin repeat-containing domain protein [Aspergillus pseudonomiae]KAB8265733.1 ankyrin repeat-containing domain protein [Aspergillus pseudonomiae]KAE8405780.1 ankyrin repeat-containing domain protein [Aspergillus pseudonomiae]